MKTMLRILRYLILATVLLTAVAGAAIWLIFNSVFDDTPAIANFEQADLDDLKRIKTLAIEFQQNHGASELKTVSLVERDINLAIGHFAPTQLEIPTQAFAKVALKNNTIFFHASVPAAETINNAINQGNLNLSGSALKALNLLIKFSTGKWINASIPASFNGEENIIIDTKRISIGSIVLTESLSDNIIYNIWRNVKSQEQTKQLIDAWKNVKSIAVNQQKLDISFVLPRNQYHALNSYQSVVLSTDEIALIELYYRHLLNQPKSGPLVNIFAGLFELAKTRSLSSGQPVNENKAALLALSKRYGGDQLVAMLQSNGFDAMRRAPKPYTIYKRQDLAQHYVLSAGLALIANEQVAALIGIDKEMSDLLGGSTISAWDLLADKAGARLADNATRSLASAQRTQEALSRARADHHIMPDLAADFSFSDDRFGASELTELTELIDLYIEKHSLLKK
jgi:hypothetical protein